MTRREAFARWWRSLGEAPPPLKPGEKLAGWLCFLGVAVTRWMALARSPWDWDEALFMMGLRHYSVPDHHPHPPGFPLFIGTAKLFTFAGFDRFHALQAVTFLSALAIVPAALLLGRELRLAWPTTLISAVFLALFPNVWFFGGTAFSDVPSMTLVILAMALLLRGCRSDGALYGGALVLGIAAGYRPQNLMIGFAPSMVACAWGLPRRWQRILVAAAVGAIVIVASYGAAAHLSGGWRTYREAVRLHQQYITTVDSFRNPGRPPLWRLLDDFFFWPYRAPLINVIVAVLTGVSLVVTLFRLRAPLILLLAAFGPFCVAAWLILDHFSVSRFSIGYAPLFAYLAGDGLHLLSGRWPRLERFAAAAVAAVIVVWMWPAVRQVHTEESPTWQSAEWIRNHVDPRQSTLYVHGSMQPLLEAFLPGFPFIVVEGDNPPTTAAAHGDDLFIRESLTPERTAIVFAWPRRRLVDLARDRYFEVSVLRLREIITFGSGWYDEEGSGTAIWRWMGGHSVTLLPAMPGKGRLMLKMYVPADALPSLPVITVSVNGAVIDRFRAPGATTQRTYVVASRSSGANELVIETDQVVNPAARHLSGDSRDLGIRLEDISWSAATP